MKMKMTDQYGFTDDVNGAKKPPTLAARLNALNSQNTQQQRQGTYLPQYDVMQQINPMYTRQQDYNSFAPMAMYQNYMQTGLLPAEQSSFTPYTPPAITQPAAPVAGPSAISTKGGK